MVFRVVHVGEQTFKKQVVVTMEVWGVVPPGGQRLLGCRQVLFVDPGALSLFTKLHIYILHAFQCMLCFTITKF